MAQREPIDLIKAKGKKHLSKKEYEERKEQEIDVPFVDVKAPEYLKEKKHIEKFDHYADMLLKLNIFTELDIDCLARYIISENLYLQYTKVLNRLIKNKEFDHLGRIQGLQDKAFKQCQQCARDLGLTITSRCKLVAPTPITDEEYEL